MPMLLVDSTGTPRYFAQASWWARACAASNGAIAGARAPVRHEEDGKLNYWRTRLEEAKTNPAAAAVVKRFIERPAEELYDLKADPHEMHNLAGDPRQKARLTSMDAELKKWMKEQGDTQTVFGKPLLIGEPVTLLPPAQA